MKTELSGSHRTTYDAIFQHPDSRNLAWRDVESMLHSIDGIEQQEQNGTLKVQRNGRTLILHRPVRKNIADVQELMDLRHFLVESEAAVPKPAADGAHMLVVMDHRLARVYKTTLHGSVPEQIVPAAGPDDGRRLHNVDNDSNGQRKPEEKSFYEAVAKSISEAEKILVFGSGTGASSAMNHMLAELATHHKKARERVIGAFVIDEHHLTEDQLLAKARDIYAREGAPS